MIARLIVMVLSIATLAPGLADRSLASEPQSPPTRSEAEHALRKAVEFFHWEVSSHGGYVWRYSADLTYRRGEAVVGTTTIWVQPPGTPTVGEAMLDAYEATGDLYHLDAARDTAYALCKGQRRSGGWYYSIEFDPARRAALDYRDNPRKINEGRSERQTTLDDDTTQSATRFLVRMDQALDFEDAKIHEAAGYALEALLRAQYPNGGWYVWWTEFPEPPSADEYPVQPASYPEDWPRQWQNAWTGRYYNNDNLTANMIDTLLLAHRVYDDSRYLDAAKRAGDFLILAQMPDPQPAWAQQYDIEMHPVWDRKFEPPAITGLESQGILRALMRLYRASGESKYLEPIPKAIEYLRRSELPDGRLARFYELKTNRPLYFTKDYQLTYSDADVPTHYGFVFDSNLDAIEAEYNRLREADPDSLRSPERSKPPRMTDDLANRARAVIEAMDDRGAWLDRADNDSAIIESAAFARNVEVLSTFLQAVGAREKAAPNPN